MGSEGSTAAVGVVGAGAGAYGTAAAGLVGAGPLGLAAGGVAGGTYGVAKFFSSWA